VVLVQQDTKTPKAVAEYLQLINLQ
jgi:hypothetical protein